MTTTKRAPGASLSLDRAHLNSEAMAAIISLAAHKVADRDLSKILRDAGKHGLALRARVNYVIESDRAALALQAVADGEDSATIQGFRVGR